MTVTTGEISEEATGEPEESFPTESSQTCEVSHSGGRTKFSVRDGAGEKTGNVCLSQTVGPLVAC